MMAALLRVFLFLFVTLVARAQEDQILTKCFDTDANYTSGSQYETNLKALLYSLPQNGAENPYYNTSVGTGPDRIYGYAQCMSAADYSSCVTCLYKAIWEVKNERCPNKKSATIRYYSCIIRYSDENFSKSDDALIVNLVNTANSTQPALFNRLLSGLMKNLSEEAAANPSRLASGRTNYNDFSQLYGLVQCTRDLTPNTCSSCLSDTISYIPSCCENKIGAQIYLPTCSIRYEIRPFDPASRLPPPASPSSPPNSESNGGGKNKKRTAIIIPISAISVALAAGISIVLCIYVSTRRKKLNKMAARGDEGEIKSSESFLLFDLSTLRAATDDFSPVNKLGRGGFGPVYKGKLPDGQEIAVKRLLTSSSQGIAELRNEVALVAKLQHRNLVRLLGCCIQEQEKLLVYEYVPNSSLDKFLFDRIRGSVQLDWDTRSKIVGGIARGLLYLHEDSRLRVVHLDLKPGNVLLDKNMNPKISDFGLAKLVQEDETEGNTNRIAGTYGYMAPEYLMQGQFSSKSDVFSFGVLVLEIVTGRKHSHFSEDEAAINLLDHIWKHWTEERVSELIDQTDHSSRRKEALRCIHLGLLCVQEDPAKRPSMSRVVLLLSSQLISLPAPSPPPALWLGTTRPSLARVPRRNNVHHNGYSSQVTSINLVTVSELEPR